MSFAEARARLKTADRPPRHRSPRRSGDSRSLAPAPSSVCDGDGHTAGAADRRRCPAAPSSAMCHSPSLRGIAAAQPVVAPPEVTPRPLLQLMNSAREFVINQLALVDADRRGRRPAVAQRPGARGPSVPVGRHHGGRLRHAAAAAHRARSPSRCSRWATARCWSAPSSSCAASGIRRVRRHALISRPTRSPRHFGDGQRLRRRHQLPLRGSPAGHRRRAATARGACRSPLLVLNGDILTGVAFADMLAFHREHGAELDGGCARAAICEVPYGVLDCAGGRVRAIREKPHQHVPDQRRHLSARAVGPARASRTRRRFDMTDLIQRLLDAGRRVGCFPIVEYWLDIGQPADYVQAQTDVQHREVSARCALLVTGGAGYVGSTLVPLPAGTRPPRPRARLAAPRRGVAARHLDPSRTSSFGAGDVQRSRRPCGTPRRRRRRSCISQPSSAIRPARASPSLARAVNLEALARAAGRGAARPGVRRFVFASTCSNYGRMSDPAVYVDETSGSRPCRCTRRPRWPSSRRSCWRTATAVAATPLRFATVFGVSPRMRFDLTVNEFTARAHAPAGSCRCSESSSGGPTCMCAMPRTRSRGCSRHPPRRSPAGCSMSDRTEQNYQKQQLVDLIRPYAPDAEVEYVHKAEDPRDYRVSFSRIGERARIHVASRTVPDGIAEVAALLESTERWPTGPRRGSAIADRRGRSSPCVRRKWRGNEWRYVKECLDTGWVSSVGAYVDRFEADAGRRGRHAIRGRHAVRYGGAAHRASRRGRRAGRRSAGLDADVHRAGQRHPLRRRVAGLRGRRADVLADGRRKGRRVSRGPVRLAGRRPPEPGDGSSRSGDPAGARPRSSGGHGAVHWPQLASSSLP